jgi:hypothetical protein
VRMRPFLLTGGQIPCSVHQYQAFGGGEANCGAYCTNRSANCPRVHFQQCTLSRRPVAADVVGLVHAAAACAPLPSAAAARAVEDSSPIWVGSPGARFCGARCQVLPPLLRQAQAQAQAPAPASAPLSLFQAATSSVRHRSGRSSGSRRAGEEQDGASAPLHTALRSATALSYRTVFPIPSAAAENAVGSAWSPPFWCWHVLRKKGHLLTLTRACARGSSDRLATASRRRADDRVLADKNHAKPFRQQPVAHRQRCHQRACT